MSEKVRRGTPVFDLDMKEMGYPTVYGEEFLRQLKKTLEPLGREPAQLIFSGFDGTAIEHGEPYPDRGFMFAMDETGWREQIGETNSAWYANKTPAPYIGVFDRNCLRGVYYYRGTYNEEHELIQIDDVILDDPFSDMDTTDPTTELVVHKDYPNKSVFDGLIGLIKLKD